MWRGAPRMPRTITRKLEAVRAIWGGFAPEAEISLTARRGIVRHGAQRLPCRVAAHMVVPRLSTNIRKQVTARRVRWNNEVAGVATVVDSGSGQRWEPSGKGRRAPWMNLLPAYLYASRRRQYAARHIKGVRA